MAFFVKWKGYPETENSWVLEEDWSVLALDRVDGGIDELQVMHLFS